MSDTARRPAAAASPVFVLGAARSGTSLVYKALCLHRDAAYVSNWLRRWPRRPELAALDHAARRAPSRRRAAWFGPSSNAYVYGRPRAVADRLFPMPVEGEPVFAACSSPDGALDPAALRRTVERIVAWSPGRVFVSKRIANNRRVDVLRTAFPDARFVHVVRDGRAVAFSLSKVDWWEGDVVWWYGDTPARWRDDGRDPWELCARNWVEDVRSVRDGLRRVAPGRVLRVGYERIVADPVRELRRIARFAGLRPDPVWEDELSRLRFGDRNASWRESLAPDTVATIEQVQRPELERQGYLR